MKSSQRIGQRSMRMVFLVSATAVAWFAFSVSNLGNFHPPVAIAQRVRAEGVWKQVYEKLPDFPQENRYVSTATGKVDPENTLVGRLIRYHLYVKGRPPFFRLDWKLTLADYLGLSGILDDTDYPSAKKLRPNPTEGDVAAIRRLNRAQRDALVQVLVDAFNPQGSRPTPPTLSPTPASSPQPQPSVSPTPRRMDGSGGADLLK